MLRAGVKVRKRGIFLPRSIVYAVLIVLIGRGRRHCDSIFRNCDLRRFRFLWAIRITTGNRSVFADATIVRQRRYWFIRFFDATAVGQIGVAILVGLYFVQFILGDNHILHVIGNCTRSDGIAVRVLGFDGRTAGQVRATVRRDDDWLIIRRGNRSDVAVLILGFDGCASGQVCIAFFVGCHVIQLVLGNSRFLHVIGNRACANRISIRVPRFDSRTAGQIRTSVRRKRNLFAIRRSESDCTAVSVLYRNSLIAGKNG